MPRKAKSDLRQALIKLGVKKEPHVVRRVIDLLDIGATIHSITQGRHSETIEGYIHTDAVKNIENKIVLIKEIFRDFDSATPVAEISDANNKRDLANVFVLMEDSRVRADIQSLDESRADSESGFRLKITRETEEKVPYEKWTFHYLTSIGLATYKALSLLREHDAIYPNRVRAEVKMTIHTKETGEESHSFRLAKFRSWERWIEMHYEVYLRSMAPDIPEPHLRTAVKLVTRGTIDANSHLEVAGNGIARYAIWQSQANKTEYYESLRVLNSNSRRHNAFIKRIENMLDEEIKNPVNPYMAGYLTRRKEEEDNG